MVRVRGPGRAGDIRFRLQVKDARPGPPDRDPTLT